MNKVFELKVCQLQRQSGKNFNMSQSGACFICIWIIEVMDGNVQHSFLSDQQTCRLAGGIEVKNLPQISIESLFLLETLKEREASGNTFNKPVQREHFHPFYVCEVLLHSLTSSGKLIFHRTTFHINVRSWFLWKTRHLRHRKAVWMKNHSVLATPIYSISFWSFEEHRGIETLSSEKLSTEPRANEINLTNLFQMFRWVLSKHRWRRSYKRNVDKYKETNSKDERWMWWGKLKSVIK